MSLPLSRQDHCPSCGTELHVCKMCRHYAEQVTKQCTEDDAEEVMDKERVNFCDWFVAAEGAFDQARAEGEARAAAQLEALFGDTQATDADAESPDPLTDAAERLFR